MVGLGDFSGGGLPDSHAFAVSGDGATVVGRGRDSSGVRAFVWTQLDGMRFLSDLLTERGVTSHND